MSFRKTLLMAALLGAVLVYVYYVEIPRTESAREGAKLLPGIRAEQIESLEFGRKDGAFTLVNTAPDKGMPAAKSPDAAIPGADVDSLNLAKWELGGIKGSEIDRGSLNSLLSSLTQLRLEKPLPANEIDSDLSIYGLKEPEVTLKINIPGQAKVVRFGKKNEYLMMRYLNVEGFPEIYLVPEYVFAAASHSKTEFRDKSPIKFVDTDVSDISMADGSSSIKLASLEAGQWRILEPLKAAASAQAVSALSMALRNVQAGDFVEDTSDAARYRLDKPDLKVLINFKEAAKRQPLEVALSRLVSDKPEDAAKQWVYMAVQGKPGFFRIDKDPIALLMKPINDFREKKLFQFSVDDVSQVDFERDDAAPLSLMKTGEKWAVNGKEADPVFAREMLKNLSQLEASAFPVENRDYGFGAPKLKALVRFAARDGAKAAPDRMLVVGAGADTEGKVSGNFYAGVDDLSQVFIINQQSLARITPKEDALVKGGSGLSGSAAGQDGSNVDLGAPRPEIVKEAGE